MKLVCVFLILFSLQCIESAPNCPDGQSWCAGRLQGSCCGHPGTCTTFFGCVYPSPGHPFDVKNGKSRPKPRGYE
eukprot:14813.XXX_729846_729545_1 [CDS] Oithona nana genome sequencing.